MWLTRLGKLTIGFLICLLPYGVQAEVAIPPLHQRVTDLTQTLSPPEQQALEQRLMGLEQRSGAQVAILLVPTTQPEDIFSYGMRVVENWKLGKKGKDDGVLILLAKNDRKSQILVGYGLEGNLPDVSAKRILDDQARPYFKNGDFNGGLNVAVSAVALAIEGKVMEASQTHAQPHPRAYQHTVTINPRQALAFQIAIGIFALGQVLRFMFGPIKAAAAAGIVGLPAVGLIMGSIASGLVWGAGLFLLVLVFRFSWLWLLLLASNSGGGRGGGYSGGGGGGFSGGGGGFGGGGSSGSW